MAAWIINPPQQPNNCAIFILHVFSRFKVSPLHTQSPRLFQTLSLRVQGLDWQLAFCVSLSVQLSCHSAGSLMNSPPSFRWTRGVLSPRQQVTSTSPKWTHRTAETTPALPPVRRFPRAFSPITSPLFLLLSVSILLPTTGCLNVFYFFYKFWFMQFQDFCFFEL